MRVVFNVVFISICVSGTRRPSEPNWKTYLNHEIELSADANQIVAKTRAVSNANEAVPEHWPANVVSISFLNASHDLRGDVPLQVSEKSSAILSEGEDPFEESPEPGPEQDALFPEPFKTIQGLKGETYTFLQQLGVGGFGEVWSASKGRPENTNDLQDEFTRERGYRLAKLSKYLSSPPMPDFAIKITQGTTLNQDTRSFWNEVRSMQKLEGVAQVVRMHAFFRDKQGRHYIVLEYLPGGDLWTRLENEDYSMDQAEQWFRGLLKGVRSMHRRGIAHRDLNPMNLLIAEDNTLKIADFGSACDAEVFTTQRSGFTQSYVAPEVLNTAKGFQGYKADVFSLGVILFLMVTGTTGSPTKFEPPFAMYVDPERKTWNDGHRLVLSKRHSVDPHIINICESMLQKDVGTRETNIAILLDMPWNEAEEVAKREEKDQRKERETMVLRQVLPLCEHLLAKGGSQLSELATPLPGAVSQDVAVENSSGHGSELTPETARWVETAVQRIVATTQMEQLQDLLEDSEELEAAMCQALREIKDEKWMLHSEAFGIDG